MYKYPPLISILISICLSALSLRSLRAYTVPPDVVLSQNDDYTFPQINLKIFTLTFDLLTSKYIRHCITLVITYLQSFIEIGHIISELWGVIWFLKIVIGNDPEEVFEDYIYFLSLTITLSGFITCFYKYNPFNCHDFTC